MILCLVGIAKMKGEPDIEKVYWNTYHCQKNVIISENKLYSNYCKNRFCTICSAIRKAEIINKYYPTLSEWRNIHFVTLTVKSCKAKNLNKWISGMFRAFELIHNRCKKRYQRGKSVKLIGIKSLECNFNPKSKTYNPHFHLIVPTKEIADLLKKEWLYQWKSDEFLYTSSKAQYIRPVVNLERDLIETIKYGSKIFTEPDLKKKTNKSISPIIYAHALDDMFSAMKDKRIFERFGFNLPKKQTKESEQKLITNSEEWIFHTDATDWINTNTSECLTGYLHPPELSYILNEYINTQLY